MDQFSRLHTFERPCFVCTSAKNNKLVVSFSYRIRKMPSNMARKTTPQARKVAVCQARLPGPWCGRWSPLGTRRAHATPGSGSAPTAPTARSPAWLLRSCPSFAGNGPCLPRLAHPQRLVSPTKHILVSLVCGVAIPRPAPALSSILPRHSLSPAPVLFLRYAGALFHASPALFLSLPLRSISH